MCVADEETGGALRRAVALRAASRRGALRPAGQRGRRRGASSIDGRRLYGVCCAEKGVFRFTLTADGRGGSRLDPAHRATTRCSSSRRSLDAARRAPASCSTLTPEPAALLPALGEGDGDTRAAALERVREADPRLAMLVEPMLGVTFTPTMARASEKINVIPSRARDQGRLPRAARAGRGRRARARRGGARRRGLRARASTSRGGQPLADRVAADGRNPRLARRAGPGRRGRAHGACPGFTDSRWFRVGLPRRAWPTASSRRAHGRCFEGAPLIHGADERIDVARPRASPPRFYRAASRRRVLG